MGRNGNTYKSSRRPQTSKRTRVVTPDLELMVRFTAARDRDREGMGR